MRICIVYDCLYPHTVGGAERWYRNLAERLVARGHEVTYLTLRQWDRGVDPGIDGVSVKVVGPRMNLYAGPGKRRILPPLVFGVGVAWHLLRHGRRYDAVHTDSFPYFSVLAAALARRFASYALVVDWFEVWSREYWTEYLGRAGGVIGWLVQLACIRVPQRAFCFSHLHAQRLQEAGLRGNILRLTGLSTETGRSAVTSASDPPTAVFAGRHIPEKQVLALVPAIAAARESVPTLHARIIGDGPERAKVLAAGRQSGMSTVIEVPGFVASETVDAALSSAACMVLPSRREGYGLVVIEAASHGTPSVVVRAPDNAAVELVDEGVNGYTAASASPEDLAQAILAAVRGGEDLRASTAAWFEDNTNRLSIDGSLETVIDSYA